MYLRVAPKVVYMTEVYRKNRSILILENINNILTGLLTREFKQSNSFAEKNSAEVLFRKITAKPSKKYTRHNIAKSLNISPHELDKICIAYCGSKFSKMLLNIRMKKALKLLKENVHNCEKISELLGYGSVFSFSRAFKAYYGKSPTKFSQRILCAEALLM